MKNEDAQLINRFLTGDESAFTALVKKHQKRVHALVAIFFSHYATFCPLNRVLISDST